MVLADTSIWVDYLKLGTRGPARAMQGLLARDELVVCGPVVAELLVGMSTQDRDPYWHRFSGLRWADLGPAEWRRAGEVGAALRERGRSMPITDVAIAVAAESASAELWTRDADFDSIAAVMPDLRRFVER